jgi:glycosyltransferase involved in cell wall biosynthesis
MVSPSLALGGAERLVVDLAFALSARGISVAMAAPHGPLLEELPGGVPSFPLARPGRAPAVVAAQVFGLAKALRRFAPDLVHAHNPRMTFESAIACRLRRGRGPVLVSTFHGVTPGEYRRAALLLRLADRVVSVSSDARALLERASLPGARLSVIENGISVDHVLTSERRTSLDRELGLGAGAVVASVGRLVPQKNPELFLEAAVVVAQQRPDTRFLVVGDGPLRPKLERRATELGLGGRLRLLGARSDARDLIARCDVLAFSSHWEGLSVAALEAMAAEVPVVATDVQGMRELLGGGAGIIVQSRTPEALGGEIVRLVDDPLKRATMGRIGRDLVKRRYSGDRMAAEYVALYGRATRPDSTGRLRR